jgi:DNA-binding response OmpR family regulator
MTFFNHRQADDRQRILVADNDFIIRSVLRALFTKIGQSVDPVATSDDALNAALRQHYNIVILDIDMPPDGGLHVCRSLRGYAAYAETPVVMLTGLDTADARSRAQHAGATLFVAKPFNPAEFLRLLVPYLRVDDPDQPQLAEIFQSDRGVRVQDAVTAQSAARNG